METGLPPGKYNDMHRLFLVKLTSSFLTIHYNATHACTIIHYNAGAGYKEVTLKNHGTMDLQLCMEIFLPRKYTEKRFLLNPFSSDAYRPHNTL